MTTRNSVRDTLPSGFADYRPHVLLCAVVAALAMRLAVAAFAYPSFLAPGREHWEFAFETGKIARSLVLGHGFSNPFYGGDTGPTAWVAPVPPYLLACIFALFGIYTKSAALATLSLNSLVSALTCIPIFFMAKKSFGSKEALWAAWTWAFFPYAIYFSADSMWDHALITLLLSCILWATLNLQDSTRKWAWAGFGVLCGLSALTNPVVLSVVPFLGAWACCQLNRQRRAWAFQAATAAMVTCAVVAPWMIRNYRTFHQPVFIKDVFPLEVCVGNIGNTLHWWNGVEQPSGNGAELAELRRVGEQAYMAEKWSQAREFIEYHPGIFLSRSVRRLVYMWTGYWSFDKEYLREEPFDLGDIPFCTATTILALIGLRKMFQRGAGLVVPYALLLAIFPFAYYITHPDMSYRNPLDPEVVLFACCAAVSWRSASQRASPEQLETATPLSYAD
jgi:hypothetical protein